MSYRTMIFALPLLASLLAGGGVAGSAGAGGAGAGGSEEPTVAEVQEQLMAEKDQDRAVAAYDAGRLGYIELAPDLVRALARDNERPQVTDDRGQRSRAMILDAMIRLEIAPDPAVLCQKLYPSCLGPALVLIGRQSPIDLSALRSIHQAAASTSQVHWVAAALLAHHGDSQALNYLMDAVMVTIQISVRDPGDTVESYVWYGRARGGWATSHKHVPPRVDYFLTTLPEDGFAPLGDEAPGVFQRRQEAARSGRAPALVDQHHAAIIALSALHAIARSPADDLFEVSPHFPIDWTNDVAFLQTARTAETQLREQWRRLATALQHEGNDVPDPKNPRVLSVSFSVEDLRSDDTQKIPDLR